MRRVDLIGQTFASLSVVGTVQVAGRRQWLCQCRCGEYRNGTTGNLKRGLLTSCGCETRERKRAARLQHGHNAGGRRTKEYRAWAHIRGRCERPTDAAYPEYGGRGIRVCDAWQSFDAFLADMGPAPSPKHSIDRIDNDGNYEPGNCRWATPAEQARNTRRTIRVDGKPLRDVCDERGLSHGAVQARIRRGDPIESALSPLTGHAYRASLKDQADG